MAKTSLKKLYPLIVFLNLVWWICVYKFIDSMLFLVPILTLTTLMGLGGLLFGSIRFQTSPFYHLYLEGTVARVYGAISMIVSIFFVIALTTANQVNGYNAGMVIIVSAILSGTMVVINLFFPD